MAKAKNYYEWLKCAERMDELEGRNKWREVADSSIYNHRMLQVGWVEWGRVWAGAE
jgi:hypothetical protein